MHAMDAPQLKRLFEAGGRAQVHWNTYTAPRQASKTQAEAEAETEAEASVWRRCAGLILGFPAWWFHVPAVVMLNVVCRV